MSEEEKAGLAVYHARMRAVVRWSAVIALVAAALSAAWFPIPALALAVGGLCGILNAVLTACGLERLARSRNPGSFVLSSFLRIGVFGIVPVAFAAAGPWWSMVWYFAGFFLPTALYAVSVSRAF
jgi:hypothetical protein